MRLPIDTSFNGDTPDVYRTSDGTIRQFTSRILVDGEVRPHKTWRIRRDLSSGLPEQVAGFHGVTQATADVEWSHDAPVNQFATNPWNPSTGWTPDPGQRIQIIVRDEHTGNEWTQFTGRVDDGAGRILGSVSSTLIDDYDQLSAEVSHDALARIMPNEQSGGSPRSVGLVSTYYVDYAMRAAGFYPTPLQEPTSILFAPCQGGMWPHVGAVVDAGDYGSGDTGSGHAANHAAPWGFTVSNFRVDYRPWSTAAGSRPLQMSFMVAEKHTGFFEMVARYGDHSLRVVADGRTIIAYRNTGTQIEACRLTASQMEGATIVSMVSKPGSISLRNDQGVEAEGPGWSSTNTLTRINVAGNHDARIAGIQANHPPTYSEHRPTRLPLTAAIGTKSVAHLGTLVAVPAIERVTAENLLSNISHAVLAGIWIDEHGRLQWESTRALTQQPVVDTVTTLNDITSLAWRKNLLGTSSQVTVRYKQARLNPSQYFSNLVWEGSRRDLAVGESVEDIISPGRDEAWIMVDDNPRLVGYANWETFDRRGSSIGYTVLDDDDEEWPTSAGSNMNITMEKIGPDAWKIRHEVVALPSGTTAQLSTSDQTSRLRRRSLGIPLPRICAGTVVMFEDAEYVPSGVAGPGPAFVHDAGHWLAAEGNVQAIGDYLRAETSTARVVITGLEVLYDPRRQLGDRIRIESPDLMGVTLDALINEITNEFTPESGYTQTLGVTVLSAATTFQTYEAFNAAGGRLSYQQWNAITPSRTYAQWDTATGSD